MSTALALVAPSELSQAEASHGTLQGSRGSSPPASQRRSRALGERPFVYGDSTPFPHDWNCIETIKEAVVSAVGLLTVQHALERGRAREKEIERRLAVDRARLLAVAESVERTLFIETKGAAPVVTRTAQRIVLAAKQFAEGEIQVIEGEAQSELTRLRDAMFEARIQGTRALEKLLAKHDLPGTRLGFRLVAKETGYTAEALVSTTFGVNAVFELAIPATDAWSRRRRVAEVSSDTFVHVPKEAGWFSKRLEMTRLPLDKLYVLAASGDGDHGMMILGRGQRAGAGYELEIDASCDPPRIVLAELDEQGNELSPQPIELGGEDRGRILQLWRHLRESLADVLTRRSALVTTTFDNRPFENEEPHAVAKRMVDAMAPTVLEIARRSGASGELVLRRNVRTGRRDEVYVTKAELSERVMTLAPNLRKVFDVLELDGPRSPRAPEPSLAAYEEVSAELLEH